MDNVKKTLDKLRQFDTPTICNVIELFEIRPRNQGFMDHRIRSAFPEMPPMVGFACTSAFRSDQPPGTGVAYGILQTQLEQFKEIPGPAVVVFEDLDNPAVGATFGEVMCSTYKAFGASGLITSGGGRDLMQVKALDFPVFTGSTICAHANCHILHVGLPVRVGGLTVCTGELLHGDANGVTQLPIDIAAEAADVAAEFLEAESLVMDYVKGDGPKDIAAFTETTKAMAEVVKRLRKQVSRAS